MKNAFAMRKIEMVDLKAQYQKIKVEIDQAIQEVVDSAAFIGGKPVQDFARDLEAYLGVKHVIPCANGTDALQIAMMALGLQEGDEVICPSFTYFATAEVIALLKLTPVFVDVNDRTFNMEAGEVEKAITHKTKAIVPVNLYGQSVDIEPLIALGMKYNIPLIEDNAQAIGGEYVFGDERVKKTGTMTAIGTTSFFPSKNLGCYGDGGALTTHDDALAEKIRMIANHGQRTRYYHEMIGVNSRLDTIQAAVLKVKLRHLDEYAKARRKAADFYDRAFSGQLKIKIPYRSPNVKHVFHQYTLIAEEKRNELAGFLNGKNIPAMIYYPVLCHSQNAFAQGSPYGKGVARVCGELKNSFWLSDRVLSLPMHTELNEEQLGYITKTVLEFYN